MSKHGSDEETGFPGSGEVFASPVTYLASYVIPTEKRTAGELQTLNEILKLGGGGSGREDERIHYLERIQRGFRVTVRLVMVRERTWEYCEWPRNNSNSSHEKGNITQTLDRMWMVLDEHGRAKNLKAAKGRHKHKHAPLRDLHYLDPLRPTLTPANIFIRPKCLIELFGAHEIYSHRGNCVVLERGKFGGETLTNFLGNI